MKKLSELFQEKTIDLIDFKIEQYFLIKMTDDNFIKSIDCTLGIAKWYIWQMFLYFLMPYLWNYEYGIGTMVSMLIYTAFYVVYWGGMPKEKRLRWSVFPYLAYCAIITVLFHLVDGWSASLWRCWILPVYGLACLVGTKLIHKSTKVIWKKNKGGKMIVCLAVVLFIVALKCFSVLWMCKG